MNLGYDILDPCRVKVKKGKKGGSEEGRLHFHPHPEGWGLPAPPPSPPQVKNPDQSLSAINVSYTDALPEREERALLEFADLYGMRVQECILLTKDTQREAGRVRYIPLWKWLLRQR